MKSLVALFGLAGFLTTAQAQEFSIDSFTIGEFRGTSTGGVYSLTGTIDQPGTDVSSSANYTIIGSFSAGSVEVQASYTPRLLIRNLSNGAAQISWLPNTPGFVLQEAGSLPGTPLGWANAPAAFTNGATIPGSLQTRFFRLVQP